MSSSIASIFNLEKYFTPFTSEKEDLEKEKSVWKEVDESHFDVDYTEIYFNIIHRSTYKLKRNNPPPTKHFKNLSKRIVKSQRKIPSAPVPIFTDKNKRRQNN